MVRLLIPLHEPVAAPYRLPREGVVTVGRRKENQIICNDVAVSGHHCKVVCRGGQGSIDLEVIDCSTNGTFVNDRKLSKGEHVPLGDGDVLSLTKVADGQPDTRVQFKLELRPGDSPALEETPEENAPAVVQAGDMMPSLFLICPGDVPSAPRAATFERSASAEGFAQDLLIQEQQSKAKITGELLLARRRLDDGRSKTEGQARELTKVRTALEKERARRVAAQSAREKLESDALQLRGDKRQLLELRKELAALQDQHDRTEVELTAQVQRASSLEAAQERTRCDLERSRAAGAQVDAQVSEMQARLGRSSEQGDRAEAMLAAARAEAGVAQRELERLQRELSAERAAREQLEDQHALLRAEVERAEAAEGSARQLSSASTAQHEELELRASACLQEAGAARQQARAAQDGQEAEIVRIERLRGAALRFADALRIHTDLWARELGGSAGSSPGGGCCSAHGGAASPDMSPRLGARVSSPLPSARLSANAPAGTAALQARPPGLEEGIGGGAGDCSQDTAAQSQVESPVRRLGEAGTPRSPVSSCPHSPRAAAGQAPSSGPGAAGATAVASWAGSPADESDVEVLSSHVVDGQAAPLWNIEIVPCGPGSYTAAGGLEDQPSACAAECSKRRSLLSVGGVIAADGHQNIEIKRRRIWGATG